MDGILSTNLLFSLKRSADCYISLHRSEGWGLNLLESVMMGIPVIHTAFGGSEQFMRPLYEKILPEFRIPYQMINVTHQFPLFLFDFFESYFQFYFLFLSLLFKIIITIITN